MPASPDSQQPRSGFIQVAASLLVAQPNSTVADGLARGLRALGVPVTRVATPYDAVTEAARREGAVARLIVGVDFFGPEEFRVLPLFRREWPDTMIVAYHSPGFEHKGRIAELVGADFVVAGSGDLSRFLQMVAAAHWPRPPAPAVPPGATDARPHRRRTGTPARPAPAAPSSAYAGASPARPTPIEAETALARSDPQAAAARPATRPASDMARSASVETDEPGGAQPAFAEVLRRGPASPVAPPPPAGPEPAAVHPAVNPQDAAMEPPPEAPRDGLDNLDGDDELARGRVLGTVELTEEELRLLLGEDDDH